MEASTYELIRRRLNTQATDLRQRLDQLNLSRKETFGAVETQLIATDRITTSNNCIPRDMVALDNHFLFGYNVHVGLRAEVKLQDVFAAYRFEAKDHTFHEEELSVLNSPQFQEDFQNLYKYYKDTVFSRFAVRGPHLFMVFQVGKSATEVKTFKWAIEGGKLHYLGNRFDHEYSFPKQHEFTWKKVTRDDHRRGTHPHVSVLDRIFVETIGGDLTVKVEDNTETGLGIYAEPVDYPDQTLDDADYQYADLGNIILLKIRPYQEKETRYLIFNEKLQEVIRVDSLADSCIHLPDSQGIIFSNGFYLQTGERKIFDQDHAGLKFENKIVSPNGEDFLYVFYHLDSGQQILLPYNLVNMNIESPIHCGGFTTFPNGELCYFRAEEQPGRHHMIQIWQTPFGTNLLQEGSIKDSWLAKVGNKDLVRGMAECNELLTLLGKDDNYNGLYVDLVKKTGDILDSYYWIGKAEAANLDEPLKAIRETAASAIDEYEKVRSIRENTTRQTAAASQATEDLMAKIRRHKPKQIMEFVGYLGELRVLRGDILGLKELRYVEEEQVTKMEAVVVEQAEKMGQGTVEFLLTDKALQPYQEKVAEIKAAIEIVKKVSEAKETGSIIDQTGDQLELLIDVVGNLSIEDATQTTSIIERVSEIFGKLNGLRSALKNRRKELLGTEAKAEFFAQLKLLEQGLVNYLDLSDTPQKAEEYLTRLMVQVEELEGKFVEFDEFTLTLSEKREEIYNAFETRRLQLVEARSKRANSLFSAADRILKGIRNRSSRFAEVKEINAYFASDLMVEKVRDIIENLTELEDPVKAGDIQTRLKTAKEEAVRQLKDRKELFVDGENIIRMGRHSFAVNKQNLDLTIVPRDNKLFTHITGTDYFAPIADAGFEATRPVWDQSLVSENRDVYRAEFLAWKFLQTNTAVTEKTVLASLQAFMSDRYTEGYTKGVHDQDAAKLVLAIGQMEENLGLLRYATQSRVLARLCWDGLWEDETKQDFINQIRSRAAVKKAFPESTGFGQVEQDLSDHIIASMPAGQQEIASVAAKYLCEELSLHDDFVVAEKAVQLQGEFLKYLKLKKKTAAYDKSLSLVEGNSLSKWALVQQWVQAFSAESELEDEDAIQEAAIMLFDGVYSGKRTVITPSAVEISGMQGDHGVIIDGKYSLDYHRFNEKLTSFESDVEPMFHELVRLKHEQIETEKQKLRLEEFQPKVMTSFVRNQLIDKLYLQIVGDNLAKQLGTVGDTTRTDRQGLLLLISPPGYGKTTLMEYVANRLGLVFMKVNGPAIGHQVTSLDPTEAPNASAKEELNKLNLALEMGDNVMLYLDDIQHCHPEFLQKFISLTDAQRKIEGVYRGISKTYDLRGKKVAVVMAGNPYTESGEKFRIPDMLSNRADTYNLGDIIGGSGDLFKLSYLENALAANPVVSRLTNISGEDSLAILKAAETGREEGIELESNLSREELGDILSVLKKMVRIRDLVLQVNQSYIESAGQQDEYRVEPPFLLQGSYRNMARMTEKLSPIMNEEELDTLVLSHYESEAQTLTTGAEVNFLKFREMMGKFSPEEKQRRDEIVRMYLENKRVNMDRLGQMVEEMRTFTEGLLSIRDLMAGGKETGN